MVKLTKARLELINSLQPRLLKITPIHDYLKIEFENNLVIIVPTASKTLVNLPR